MRTPSEVALQEPLESQAGNVIGKTNKSRHEQLPPSTNSNLS
jgi:hypothetical protein